MPRVEIAPGKYTDPETACMIREVQRKARHAVLIAQGSGSTSVSASGQTHAGPGGVVDMRTVPLTRKQKMDQLIASRQVGFAAWIRPYVEDLWGEHEHAVAIGSKYLSSAAEQQVQAAIGIVVEKGTPGTPFLLRTRHTACRRDFGKLTISTI